MPNKDNFKSYMDEEKNKASNLYEEGKQHLKEGYQEGKQQVKGCGEEVKDKVEGKYQQIKESASDLYEQGKKGMDSAQTYLEEQSLQLVKAIKAKPLTAVLIAGAVGYLASKLISKKS